MNRSPTGILSIAVVSVCCFRFLLDGVSFSLFGHPFSIGHTDPTTYATFLTPVLGAHSYVQCKIHSGNVDNPDK